MSDKPRETAPTRHVFIDTHKLSTAQRGRLFERLQRILGHRYYTSVDRPGDGTATVSIDGVRDRIELVEALTWRLIDREYRSRLLLDDALGRLRAIHEALPPPDVSQEIARRQEQERRFGGRSLCPPTASALAVYPLSGDGVNGDDFSPDTGEPPVMEAEELDGPVAEYYPRHQDAAKAFFQALDQLLRRYVRLFMAETGPRWQTGSDSGDAACAAFRSFRHIVEDALCPASQAG